MVMETEDEDGEGIGDFCTEPFGFFFFLGGGIFIF